MPNLAMIGEKVSTGAPFENLIKYCEWEPRISKFDQNCGISACFSTGVERRYTSIELKFVAEEHPYIQPLTLNLVIMSEVWVATEVTKFKN